MRLTSLLSEAPAAAGAALLVLALLLLLNWLAYRHAYAMTHFVPNGSRNEPDFASLRGKLRLLLYGLELPRPESTVTPADYGLPFEKHAFAGGRDRLAAWHIPHARRRGVVVLFHGYGGCKANVLPEAKAFHEMGYACFLVDFPGCGDSTGDATTIGCRETADVVCAADYVRAQWPGLPLILYGASMGGAAVLGAVALHGAAAAAVVTECPFDRLLHAVAARCRLLGVPAFPLARLLVFWGGLRLGFNGFRHNPAEYARDVRCPVLLLHGTEDRKVPSAQIEAIHARLAGAKALHYFEGLEHESYVEKRPEEWKRLVGRFLETHRESALARAS